jgi:hypothetical protein
VIQCGTFIEVHRPFDPEVIVSLNLERAAQITDSAGESITNLVIRSLCAGTYHLWFVYYSRMGKFIKGVKTIYINYPSCSCWLPNCYVYWSFPIQNKPSVLRRNQLISQFLLQTSQIYSLQSLKFPRSCIDLRHCSLLSKLGHFLLDFQSINNHLTRDCLPIFPLQFQLLNSNALLLLIDLCFNLTELTQARKEFVLLSFVVFLKDRVHYQAKILL